MTSEEERKQKIWERVLADAQEIVNGKRPGEMTTEDIVQETGMARRTAHDFLQARVITGELTVRKSGGRNYYSPV